MRFSFFFTKSCASSNDLLKFSHWTNIFIKHDKFCHFTIRTSWKQFWSCSNNWIWRRNRNKIIEFLFPIIIWPGNANNIVRIFGAHVCIEIGECNSHAFSCIFCGTKNNCFLHSIRTDKVICYFTCNLIDSISNDNIIVVVSIIVYPILNFFSVVITLSL